MTKYLKENLLRKDYISVTEIAGDEVTQEQIDRLCNRYYWAGKYSKGKDVVEAACGTGQGLSYLSGISKSLEAGDYSDAILSIARKRYSDRVILRQFDAQDMPFQDQSKDVIILFEAIYYLPDAKKFVKECARVLRPGGVVLVATANKDLYDFNPSPHSFSYYGTVELNALFAAEGFRVKCFGDTPIRDVSWRQKLLRPLKKTVVALGLMPKSMAGKKFLKRMVFGGIVKMPAEIGPPIAQMDSNIDPQNPRGEVYSGRYVAPVKIALTEPDRAHKVILCVAQRS
jgi:SAM-dependent methyltransferase